MSVQVRGIGRRTFVCAAAGGLALLACPGIVRVARADEAAPASGQAFEPGTYHAAARGRKGPVEVAVTFSEDRIESVELVSSWRRRAS